MGTGWTSFSSDPQPALGVLSKPKECPLSPACPVARPRPGLPCPCVPLPGGLLPGQFRLPEAPCTGESPTHPRDGIGMQWGQERAEPGGHRGGWSAFAVTLFLLCPCLPHHLSLLLLRPTCSLPPLPPSSPITPAPELPTPGPCPPFTRGPQAPGPAPQELWFEVQGSALMLHWRLPRELGGRGDLLFNVVCKECGGPGARALVAAVGTRCISPRQRGLTESRVLIGGCGHTYPLHPGGAGCQRGVGARPDPPQAAAITHPATR